MKKKYFIFALLAFGMTSCLDKPEDLAAKKALQIAALETLADYDVPVKDGFATIVALSGETLAVVHEPTTISVPRYALESGELEVTYSAEDVYDNFSWYAYWQYLSFEDTRLADYDYNDLVIHARIITTLNYHTKKYTHVVAVQPVALGGSRTLQLGILYKEDGQVKESILSQNVRQDIFFGNPLFPINTDPEKEVKKVSSKLVDYLTVENYEPVFKVVWFIDNGTDRLYAATTNFGADKNLDMISADGLPYGISLTKTWDYPAEKQHIRKGYPGFDEWLRTGNEETLLKNSVKEFLFPAKWRGAGSENLWDWEKN